ncbi:MAG: TRAP transporter permease [Proteobacteria bacterium]|nr:TRAP transporter permease [Pseudomonadota bacterium]
MLGNTRLGVLIPSVIALCMMAFHFWVVAFGAPEVFHFRGTHLLFALVLTFLWFPVLRDGTSRVRAFAGAMIDTVMIAGSIAVIGYLFWEHEYILTRFAYVDELRPIDAILGVMIIGLVLESTRRIVGLALPITAMIFLLYGIFFANLHAGEVIDQLYLTTEGIFGIPLNVSATYLVLFIVFGSLVEKSGTGKLFMEFSLALAGHTAGGPAKVACMTSAMFGTISGSSTANVMTTGTFTIPMMKKIGYRPAFAGAVEAVASTGGQIMPPIMGAAAFVMAEFMAVSYLTVIGIAILPALLYFLAVFVAVHFEAKRIGLKGLPRADLPEMGRVLRERGHQFLPLVVIVGILVGGYSAPYAATLGLLSVIPITLMRKTTRADMSFRILYEAILDGIRNSLQVATATACSGIVIGIISLSGIGIDFTSYIIQLSQDTLLLALILTAIAGIILGMGLPTTPAYIVQVALLVPALIKLGVALEAAHMFVFYFAILSAITPPVAITLYAANGLSGAGLWDGGLAAMKLAATGYIIPFMFVYGPSLLLIGDGATVALACVTSVIGVICLAAGLHGYFLRRANILERLLLVAAAITLIKPGIGSDLAGAGIVGLVAVLQLLIPRDNVVPQ